MTLDEKKELLLQKCNKKENAAKITPETHPIHITEWGNSGPTVLLIHGGVQGGLGGGPINYINQKELADKGYKLRVPNRPGFGESPSRGADSQTADAVWIAEELGKSSHLVGHSFGGAEALLAAAIRPEAVQSLVLIEPALQPILATDEEGLKLPEIQEALQVVSAPLMEAESPADFARIFSQCMGTALDGGPNPSAAALEAHPESAGELGCALLNAVLGTPEEIRAAADIVKAKGIPVFVISGGYSASQDACCKAIARLTGGKHIIIPCPNHFIQQDSSKLFNEFLDKEIQSLSN